MRVMLTSCGLETPKIREAFLAFLGKKPAQAHALFIPTAAIDADAIAVLPKCMDDLLDSGIPKKNIRVFDLHRNIPDEELKAFDVVYLCGGKTSYLLDRINSTGFRETLMAYIRNGGFVIGVSAGSLIFTCNLPHNLALLNTTMDVHCDQGDPPGKVTFPLQEKIRLTNTGAMLIRNIPDDVEIIDG